MQAALALWVILAHPRRVLNWAVGALLLLWAGSGVLFQLWREASLPGDRLLFGRVGDIYEAPTFLLILLVIDRLLLADPRPRAWRPFLVVAGAALPVFWFAHSTSTPDQPFAVLDVANAGATYLAQVAAIVLATLAANDERRGRLERRQAALFGLAFALLMAHTGAGDAKLVTVIGAARDLTLVLLAINLLGLVAAAYACVRLPAPFNPGARAAITASIVLAAIVGTATYSPVFGSQIIGGRAVVVSGFALVLAVAVLRYDLATTQADERRRQQAMATVLLGLCVAAVLGVATWALSGQGGWAVGLGVSALILPVVLLITPLSRVPAWLARRVLLHPRDPDALRERVQVYAKTLRAATGADGQLVPGAERALAALRDQLGLGQRDHDLLVSMAGDQSAGGIVAYRLALVGAQADREALDEAKLADLRERLGVTERDHALVVEHLRAGADSLSVGAHFLGRYHVKQRLGEGGFGEVWLAQDTRVGTDVVLKHLSGHERRDGAAWQRIQREVLAATLMDHPHIVAVREVETVGSDTYLVMEYMSGGSLADVLREKGRMSEADVVRMAVDVLDALAALHGRGIVHRDVKPGNILFDAKGVAKLGDFNIARELVSGDTLGGEGVRGPVGTFAYMPPEQARGLAARPQSDLYGLGATMYEALAGEPLHRVSGLSHTEAVALIAGHAPPIDVPNASPGLSEAIARALAKATEDRFTDALAMSAAISPAGTPAGSARRRPRPPA